jgi:hypothetical protein
MILRRSRPPTSGTSPLHPQGGSKHPHLAGARICPCGGPT